MRGISVKASGHRGTEEPTVGRRREEAIGKVERNEARKNWVLSLWRWVVSGSYILFLKWEMWVPGRPWLRHACPDVVVTY